MSGRLHSRNERRYDFRWHADGAAQRFVDNRPLRPGANANFPVRAGEFHQPVKPRALRRVADPGSSSDAVARISGAKVIDLMPYHDPEVGVVMFGVGN